MKNLPFSIILIIIVNTLNMAMANEGELEAFNIANSSDKAPHLAFQIRTEDKARMFLINQVYSFMQNSSETKKLLGQKITPGKEINVPLYIKKLKSDLNETLIGSLGLELGGQLSKEELILMKEGAFNKIKKSKILKRILLKLHFNEFGYKIPKDGFKIASLKARKGSDENLLDLETTFEFSKLEVDVNDICINIISFKDANPKSKDEYGVIPVENNSCDKTVKKSGDSYDAIIAQFQNQGKVNVNMVASNDPTWASNIAVQVNDTKMIIAEKDSISITVHYKLSIGENNKINLKIDPDNTHFNLGEKFINKFDLQFNSPNSVKMDGLFGFVIENKPVVFSQDKLQSGLNIREEPLLSLLVEPLKDLLQNSLSKLLNSDKPILKNGLDISGFEFAIKGSKDPLKLVVNQVNVITGQNPAESDYKDITFLGGGLNLKFPDQPVTSATGSYKELQSRLNTYIKEDFYLSQTNDLTQARMGDVAISLGEELFNDSIKFALNSFRENILKTDFVPLELQFHVDGIKTFLEEEEQMRGEEFSDTEFPTGPVITGCVGYFPKSKKLLGNVVKFLTGPKDQVQVPLLAYTELNFEIDAEGIPTLKFDINGIENNAKYLNSDPNCPVSKLFKKGITQIASNQINDKFNKFNEFDLLIIKFPALKGLPSSALKLERDIKLNRINILFSFEEIDDIVQFINKFNGTAKKFEISFPKIEKIAPPKLDKDGKPIPKKKPKSISEKPNLN